MKYIMITAAVASLIAVPAYAGDHHGRGLSTRDLIIGGIVGGLIVNAAKDSSRQDYSYSSSYNRSYSWNPCSYNPDYNLERYNPERAEYERGVAARRCQEQEDRKRRAFECGYNGTC